jgi:DNA-binding CsgD family transcriptional regulator
MQSTAEVKDKSELRPAIYPFSESAVPAKEGEEMALLALSHSKIEHQLYELMLAETRNAKTTVGDFSVRHLMIQTGLHSYSSIRRARAGLIKKLSIEQRKVAGDARSSKIIYVVYTPEEIFCRRQNAGLRPFPREISNDQSEGAASIEVMERLLEKHSLSRREAQVALRCAEGLSNSEIGKKLFIHEETVKFHLRNIFIKFGVRRRTELMAQLFRQERKDVSRKN